MRITISQNVRKGTKVVLFATLTIMWIFGVEPQISWAAQREGVARAFTYRDYMEGAIHQYGDGIGVRVLTTIAYPGARAGRLIRNALVE